MHPRAKMLFARPLAIVLAVCTLAGASLPAFAQPNAGGASYLSPFPPGDVYRILVVGDGLAEGLMWALGEDLKRDGRVRIERRRWRMDSLLRSNIDKEVSRLEADLKRDKISIVLVMLGIRDRVTVRDRAGRRQAVGSEYWRKIFASYSDKIMKMLRRDNRAVYWVGLPTFRGPRMHAAAQVMNDLWRERAYLNGVKFVDAFRGFMDAGGGYSDYGPDLTGKMRRLRQKDGLYLTAAGNRKLAHFAERVLKRDLTEAKNARLVPLAGSPDEQAKINPQAAKKAEDEKAASLGETASNLIASLTAKVTGTDGKKKKVKDGGQPADNGTVTLRTKGRGGAQETVTLEILRPAIPKSVIALVTRKQSANRPARLGETLVDRIPGGLNILSSVTPASEAGGGSKRSPTRAPFFRVLVKGERVPPRAGRADDFAWPRKPPPPPVLPASVKSQDSVGGSGQTSSSIPLPSRNPMRFRRPRASTNF